ncbi:MAG: hypothetical protein COV37_15095, partial [Bdellovibrio sp. CG11_big_fil_rev_8_21_14_0_20_39_38]
FSIFPPTEKLVGESKIKSIRATRLGYCSFKEFPKGLICSMLDISRLMLVFLTIKIRKTMQVQFLIRGEFCNIWKR